MACTIANGCCTRHPTVCSRMHAADSVQRHTHHLPTAAARRPRFAGVTSNSTYGLELPFSNTSTYWSAPVPDVPPYRKLVSRILAPFAQDGISHSRVWQSTQARTTCAVLRVSGRSVCKVSRVAQKSERSHHAPQERGLFALVREISARCRRRARLHRGSAMWADGGAHFSTGTATSRTSRLPTAQVRRLPHAGAFSPSPAPAAAPAPSRVGR
jgi:hypothetical protein